MDVNKTHDDDNGGGQREKVSVFEKSHGDIAYSILNYE